MKKYYTDEINVQIVIALLKHHKIRKVIASSGTTNISLIASLQQDPFFEIYSCVDERSASYMACGLCEESGEPVAISCTGATASRNYLSALTEAYYRKLPILAITSTQNLSYIGHQHPQIIDRSSCQKDVASLSVTLNQVSNDFEKWACEMKANEAFLELMREKNGPVHINLVTGYSKNYPVKKLPTYRIIERLENGDEPPMLLGKKMAILIGSHHPISSELEKAIELFCEKYNSCVLCDHTSNYYGKYKLGAAVLGYQEYDKNFLYPDLLIRLGEISGDYELAAFCRNSPELWRVNEDGKLVDTYQNLTKVFEMTDLEFFSKYNALVSKTQACSYYEKFVHELDEISAEMTDFPLSNVWVAQQLSPRLPKNSCIHFGILSSLRAWNYFKLPESVRSMCNVGGFGIDGCVSSLVGASLHNREKLYFAAVGDLAFFYDMNVLGNKHVGNNVRILIINNGRGGEFRHYRNPGSNFDDKMADQFISAAGHHGAQSPDLVRHYAQDLGYLYMSASTKEEVLSHIDEFTKPTIGDKPMVFEIFTDTKDENQTIERLHKLKYEPVANQPKSAKDGIKSIIKSFLNK